MSDTMRLSNGLRVCFKEIKPYGHYLALDPTPEPNSLDESALEHFEPSPSIPKIPDYLFKKLSKFFYDYASKNLEVHARVVYNPNTKSHKVFVPTQTIAGASVDTFEYKIARDLETGEDVSLPDINWLTLWQFHVHPFDIPGPSGIDDNGFPNRPGTGELDVPCGYGIFSCWRSSKDKKAVFTLRTNVVVNDGLRTRNKRLDIPVSEIVEGISDGEEILVYNASYSPKVHDLVSRFVPVVPKYKNYNLLQGQVGYVPKTVNNSQYLWDSTNLIGQMYLSEVITTYSLDEIVEALLTKYSQKDIEETIANLNKFNFDYNGNI